MPRWSMMMGMRVLVLLLGISFFALPSQGESPDEASYPVLTGSFYKLYRSPCQLELTPTYDEQFRTTPLQGCLQGRSSAHGALGLRNLRRYTPLYLTEHSGSASLHWRLAHALHWEGRLQLGMESLARSPRWRRRDTRTAVYQYGKAFLHGWQLTLGKQVLPFGLNHSEVRGYGFWWQGQGFWPSPTLAAVVTLDNKQNASLQLGADANALAARALYDISAWNGTRFALSLYGHQQGSRHIGFALLNQGRASSVNSFEWVRLHSTPDGQRERFGQLLRLGFRSPISHQRQSYLVYDDVKATYRLAILGQSIFLARRLTVDTALVYRKDERTTTGPKHVSSEEPPSMLGVKIPEGRKGRITWALVVGVGAQL